MTETNPLTVLRELHEACEEADSRSGCDCTPSRLAIGHKVDCWKFDWLAAIDKALAALRAAEAQTEGALFTSRAQEVFDALTADMARRTSFENVQDTLAALDAIERHSERCASVPFATRCPPAVTATDSAADHKFGAVYTHPRASGVRVKPLVWTEEDREDTDRLFWQAISRVSEIDFYEVGPAHHGFYAKAEHDGDRDATWLGTKFPTIEAAKAACEAHHVAAVLALIEGEK